MEAKQLSVYQLLELLYMDSAEHKQLSSILFSTNTKGNFEVVFKSLTSAKQNKFIKLLLHSPFRSKESIDRAHQLLALLKSASETKQSNN